MMRPIEWHEWCLFNRRETLRDDELRLARQQAHVEQLRRDITFREEQLARAIAQGKTEFDAERFMKKRVNQAGTK